MSTSMRTPEQKIRKRAGLHPQTAGQAAARSLAVSRSRPGDLVPLDRPVKAHPFTRMVESFGVQHRLIPPAPRG